MFDAEILKQDFVQRTCQYIRQIRTARSVDNFNYDGRSYLDAHECLDILLNHLEKDTGNKNPSWSEITHFAQFLNHQLSDCENSIFCQIPELSG